MLLRVCSNKMERPKLRWRFYAISSCILLLAVVEHLFSIAVNSEKHDWRSDSENATFQNFLQIYCASSHAFILEIGKSIIFPRPARSIIFLIMHSKDLFFLFISSEIQFRARNLYFYRQQAGDFHVEFHWRFRHVGNKILLIRSKHISVLLEIKLKYICFIFLNYFYSFVWSEFSDGYRSGRKVQNVEQGSDELHIKASNYRLVQFSRRLRCSQLHGEEGGQ